MIQQTLINTGYNIENVTYIVTPVANSCSGDTAHFTVTVYPVADVYFTPPSQAICPLQTSNITINSHVAGDIFHLDCNWFLVTRFRLLVRFRKS